MRPPETKRTKSTGAPLVKSTFRTYSTDLVAGGLFVLLAIVVQTWFMGPAIVFLDIGLILAWVVWATRTKQIASPNILPLYLIAVCLQCFHFLEEFVTGFQTEFPRLFGYVWSDQQFASFNLAWLALLIVNGVGVYFETRLSYLLVYFFAMVGGIANGVAHPLLSLTTGGYFPGLFTSPFVLIVGLALLSRLMKSK